MSLENRRIIMGLLSIIVVGLIAGWLASLIMKTRTGLLTELILGVVGALLGGWLSGLLFGADMMTGINITSILVALVGSIIVILIYRALRR
jgi:uncharacterized membrane protein YeaQ/YmgE (transglycosylase-associated protein family)